MSGPLLLALDPVGGIAGDMFLAAAVDLGVPVAALEEGLRTLGMGEFRLEVTKAERSGIIGTYLAVVPGLPQRAAHRPLSEIFGRIEAAAGLPPRAKQRALAVFRAIGEAEARIHAVPLEQVHLHEVGALDSVVDICGAALALELLGSPELVSAPPPLGSGMAHAAHGPIPVPAPATLEILRGCPVRFDGVGELTTPTGAGLLKALARVGPLPEMVVERVGYGVGTRVLPDRPNVLRAILGRRTDAQAAASGLVQLEANLDDCSPQLLGGLVETLLADGALDVWILPATMKKGRPGHLLGALATQAHRERLVQRIFRESTTLGVRGHAVHRTALDRRDVEVQTSHGPVRIKVASAGEVEMNAAPEYDDCRMRAEASGVPVKQVWAEAMAAYWGHR